METNRNRQRNHLLGAAVAAALVLGSGGFATASAQQSNPPQASGSAATAPQPREELREAQQQVQDAGEAIEEARAESREAVREGREAGRAAQAAAQREEAAGAAGAASDAAEERARTASADGASSQKNSSQANARSDSEGGVWLFVPVAVSVQTEQQAKDCWVRLYSGDDFEGRYVTITGPTAIPELRSPYGTGLNNWESAVVGRNATVTTYDGGNFEDRSATLRAGQRYADLGDTKLGLFEDIESVRVTCGATAGR